MKIIVFGTGLFYQNRKQYFKNVEIPVFLDNDPKKHGTELQGVKIIAPENINTVEYDAVCLMGKRENSDAMRLQLIGIGISEEKILDFAEFQNLEKPQKMTVYYSEYIFLEEKMSNIIHRTSKKILLVAHELSRTGAPMVLFYAAEILKSMGYSVVLVSPQDGPLRDEMLAKGITVIIDEGILNGNANIMEWSEQFEFIFACSLKLYRLMRKLQETSRPLIWWLHEDELSYLAFGENCLNGIDSERVAFFGGGLRACEAFRRHKNNGKIKELLYGVPDMNSEKRQVINHGDKLVFALLGTVCSRKGQDILLDAVNLLGEEERSRMEFRMVGASDIYEQGFVSDFKERCSKIKEVKFSGEVKLSDLMKVYPEVDVMVCASREDPMPVVLTEGMMYYKPIIVSKITGTSSFIQNEVNGLVFETGNAAELADCLRWMLNYKNELPHMGQASRDVYEENFSLEAFKKHIKSIVSELISY